MGKGALGAVPTIHIRATRWLCPPCVPYQSKRPPTGRPPTCSGFKRVDYTAYAHSAKALTAIRAAPSNIACHVGL